MLRDVTKRGQRMHRKAIEATYDGTCNIYEKHSVKDPDTKITKQEDVLVQQNIPCHLSYSSAPPASGSETVTAVTQIIKLFLAPEVIIKPGSRIDVLQRGCKESYCQSGHAAVYVSHQEILLELYERRT